MNTTSAHSARPADDHENSRSAGRTYLRRPGLRITDRWFVITGQRFEVSELRSPRTVRGAYDSIVVTTSGIAGAVLVVIAVSARLFDAAAWLGAGVVAAVPVGLAVITWRRHPRPYELWAEYRGVWVRLFGCPDEKTFGHVSRALIRAREAQLPEPPDETGVFRPAA